MSTTSPAFSARLRAASWSDHQAAESQSYLDALVTGRLDHTGYAQLVAQHWYIYQALEAAADTMRTHPVAGGFVDDALTRLPALHTDLTHLLGPDWPHHITADPATTAYTDRIHQVCHTHPTAFIAHHYTRYLGDLSGGLHIARALTRQYHLTGDTGLAFYQFPRITDPRAYKDTYRTRLDTLDLTDTDRDTLITEVRTAYHHNTQVLTGLARHVPTDEQVA